MKLSRWIHKWLGILSCLFVLVVSLSAIALNHTEEIQAFYRNDSGVLERHFALKDAKVTAVDPYDASHLLASPGSGLFQSFDRGKTWQELELYVPAEKVVGIAFAPDAQGHLYVGLKEGGVFFSDDGGDIWESVENLPFDPVAGETLEAIFVQQQSQLTLLTTTHLFSYVNQTWQSTTLNDIQQADFFELKYLIYKLHTGDILGPWGRSVYDGVALSLILLSLSGLYLAFRPQHLKRKAQKNRTQLQTRHETPSKETTSVH